MTRQEKLAAKLEQLATRRAELEAELEAAVAQSKRVRNLMSRDRALQKAHAKAAERKRKGAVPVEDLEPVQAAKRLQAWRLYIVEAQTAQECAPALGCSVGYVPWLARKHWRKVILPTIPKDAPYEIRSWSPRVEDMRRWAQAARKAEG